MLFHWPIRRIWYLLNAHTLRLTIIWYMHALWHFTRKFCCFLHYMPFAILNVSYTTQIYAYFNTIYHAWAEHVLPAHLFDLNAFLSRSYALLHICEFNTYVRISPCKYNGVNEAIKINKTLEVQTEVSTFLMMLLLLLLLRRYCCIREFTTKKECWIHFCSSELKCNGCTYTENERYYGFDTQLYEQCSETLSPLIQVS